MNKNVKGELEKDKNRKVNSHLFIPDHLCYGGRNPKCQRSFQVTLRYLTCRSSGFVVGVAKGFSISLDRTMFSIACTWSLSILQFVSKVQHFAEHLQNLHGDAVMLSNFSIHVLLQNLPRWIL